MVDSLWDLDESGATEVRVLSGKEREFLASGDSGSYTTAEMERRVATKAEVLPDRIQQLIDDVCLLHYRDQLSTEDVDLWADLCNLNNRANQVRISPILRTANQTDDGHIDIGFEVGSLLRMLSDEPSQVDLVWGFIIGLVGESSEDWEREARNLVGLFDDLEDRYERRIFSAGTVGNQDDGFDAERDEIREILYEYGFDPAPPLVDAILVEHTNSSESDLFDPNRNSWRADPDQTEHPEPPKEMPSSGEMRRTEFDSIVSRLADETNLQSLDRLAKDLREDSFRIQQRDWRGVDPDKTIRSINNAGEMQIQEFDQTTEQGQNNMTTALRRLSYDDSNWVNRPVVQENEGENMYWTLTPYGELLYETRVIQNCSVNWVYNFFVDQKQFDERLCQAILESI